MLDLVVKGGQVVTPQGVALLDIGVQGETIVALGWPGTLTSDAARTIDATGKIVVPGGIEPHAHISIPVPEIWTGTPDVMTQPPEAATRAAAFGGVTTVVDFAGDLSLTPDPNAPRMAIAEAVERRRNVFRGHAYTDFTFHYILAGEVAPQTIGQIGEAIQDGVASFKIFTTFRPIRVPYGHLSRIFEEVAKHGGIMAVHAEEDDVVTYMTETLKREGRAQGYNLHLVHNNMSEDLAFRHIIRLARHAGSAIYFVHTTAKEGVAAIAEARTAQAARDGTLSIMVGADPAVFARLRPFLDCMGTEITHCGPVGAGEAVKLMNNMVVAQTVVALAEALAVARASGAVDPEVLFTTLTKGSADSFVLRNHGLRSLLPDRHPTEGAFPTTYIIKDLSYAMALAESAGLTLEQASTTRRLMERTAAAGYSDQYYTSVIRTIEKG